MNKKGFTLIELLATLVLLAMIAMIAIPTVNSVIASNKEKNCDKLKDSIIRAATLYVEDNKYNIEWYDNRGRPKKVNIPLSTLYNSYNNSNTQYLNSKVKNPCDNSNIDTDSIQIIFQNNYGTIEAMPFVWPTSTFSCCK